MMTGQSKPLFDETKQAAQRERNTYRIGLWSGILFTLIAIVSTISTIQTGLYVFGGIALVVVIAAISFLAAYLARRGRGSSGAAILVGTILLAALTLPVIAKGQGIPLALLSVIIVSTIAYFTLTPRWTVLATIASILIGLLIILADFFLPDFGIPNDPRVTYVISAITGIIYLLALARRFGDFSLRAKLIAAFLLITLLPILALSVYNNNVTRSILTDQAQTSLNTLALETGQNIDQFILSQLDVLKMEAQQPILTDFLQRSQFTRDEALETAALKTLLTFLRKNPVFIQSYALLDMSGKVVLSTNPTQNGRNEGQTDYFRLAVLQQKPQVATTSNWSDAPILYFISPVRAESGLLVGMLRAEYDAVLLQYLVNSRTIQSALGQRVLLLEKATSLRLADTQEPENLYQPFPALKNEIQVLVALSTFSIPVENEENFFAVGQPLTTRPWAVVALQPESTVYARAETQARTLILVSIGLTVFSLALALSTAQFISRPIASLARVARAIIAGDLSARAQIRTEDEVGQLGTVFNEMTTQLSQTLSTLEQRIKERTDELERATRQSEQRARQLQTIADVSKIITREQNLEKLLPLITETVSEKFGYYHIGIFFLDETRRTAVLQASNSPGGQRMLEAGHRLPVGTGSIVGYVSLTGKPRIALDVGADAVFFDNPNLPETHSEMALPLSTRGKVIGVLDIQSKERGAFRQEDVESLQILADQIAIAIENARLFDESQRRLKETQNVIQTYLQQEWSAFARRQNTVGYFHSPVGGKLLERPIQAEEIEQAIRKGGIVQKESKTGEMNIIMPILLGNQVIGAIRAQPSNRKREWKPEEINLLRTITERVGLALDNARLLASIQRRAARERTVSEIAARISAAADIDDILKTAVQEVGRALNDADVVIQLKQFEDEE
ncbi:MAG: GAF domain-containing protein [Anaerolineales bacterium]|nr:GAF domain-containing protein [Anaerolineales bacterium]MDW8278846.1 GAF domain-containing protein [Anaerolineales bacterium]